MKEVERVSLGGYAFTFDDDAARMTEEYLGTLEKHYNGRTGGGEIMDCIEERMAELLTEKAGRDGVVSRTMIEEVIGILGRPEDIEAGEEEEDSPVEPANPPKRKLYRDLTDKTVAGVCSGLAAYLNIDVALPRLIFAIGTVVGFFGRWHHPAFHLSFPVLYVILWICMPAAKTVRQRWEQRGEDGTLDSIRRSIESGAREVDKALQSVGKSKAWTEIGGFIEKFIGVILLIVGFAGLFTSSLWGFGSGWFGKRDSSSGFLGLGRLYDQGMAELRHVAPNAALALAQPGVNILLMLVCFLPFLGLLYGALQLIFGFKSPKWHPGLVIFILWLLSVIATGILIATGYMTTEILFA